MANFKKKIEDFWRQPAQKTEEDYWQNYYVEEEPNYDWLKKAFIAVVIFFAVYMAHTSGTEFGAETVNVVRKVLVTQTDYAYWLDKGIDYGSRYFPYAVNWAGIPFLSDVRATVSRPADPLLYMGKPVEGQLKTVYGWYHDPFLKQDVFHNGIDIAAPVGANVRAAAPGKVKYIVENSEMGQKIIVEHSQDVETVYAYLGEVLVKTGELISQGQVIAKVGETGKDVQNSRINEPFIYFELREEGRSIDPLTRIKGQFLK